jgi:hypothetical protein
MALPLGAVLCFLDLLGARAFARGEVRFPNFCSSIYQTRVLACFTNTVPRSTRVPAAPPTAPYLHPSARNLAHCRIRERANPGAGT